MQKEIYHELTDSLKTAFHTKKNTHIVEKLYKKLKSKNNGSQR